MLCARLLSWEMSTNSRAIGIWLCGFLLCANVSIFNGTFWVNKSKFSTKNWKNRKQLQSVDGLKKRRIWVQKHKEYCLYNNKNTEKEEAKRTILKWLNGNRKMLWKVSFFYTLKWVFSEWVFIFLVFLPI